MMLFFVFLLFIFTHMRIIDVHAVQSAIEGEVTGEGGRTNHEGPFLDRDVHDVPTFWDWFISSFVSCTFKSADGDLRDFPRLGRLASYNQLIGGVQVTRTTTYEESC